MSKALKIGGAILGVVAIVASGGLGAVVAGAVTGFFGVGAGTLALIAAGMTLGSSLLAPKQKSPATSPSAAERLYLSSDLRTRRKIVFGHTAMATDERDREYADGQTWLHRFVVTASHRVTAYEEIWFDDKLAWTAGGGAQGDFAGYLSVTPILEGSAANAINISARMGSSRRYTGLAYIHLQYKLTGNNKKSESPFASSIPSRVTIIGKGAPVYDPRLDSTAGGSGPQRANDQTTWTWRDGASRNPALQTLWWLLGWRIRNPETGEWKLAVGKGIPAARIDLDSFITAANLCDEQVARSAGGTEPRFRSDGIFSEGDDADVVLDSLKASMNATLDDVDGKIRLTVLHNDLATPTAALTTDDVVGAFRWRQTMKLSDSFNVVRGSYTDPSPSSLYQQPDYPEVRLASPDGIDRELSVNLPMVQSPSQAQRLAKARLRRSLYPGTFSASFQATAWAKQKGDVFPFTFAPLGWSNKLFRIIDIAVQVNGLVPMVLREEHEDIYADDATDAAPIEAADPTLYDYRLNGVYQDIQTPRYQDDTPIEDLRPAEPGATNGANPDSPFGPGGTVRDALLALQDARDAIAAAEDQIAQGQAAQAAAGAEFDAAIAGIAESFDAADARFGAAEADLAAAHQSVSDLTGSVNLKITAIDLGIEAAIGQQQRAEDTLSESLLRSLVEVDRVRTVMRDAGISVDPESAEVRFWALDETRERMASAELTLNAATASIRAKASVNYVNEQILLALTDPSQFQELEGLISRITTAELEINGLGASIALKADATTLTTLQGTVNTIGLTIDALTNAINLKASSSAVSALDDRLGNVEVTITAMGDVSSIRSDLRQVRYENDEAAENFLRSLVDGDTGRRSTLAAIAEARQELTTKINEDGRAEAAQRLALAVRVASAGAQIMQEQIARASGDSANAQAILAVTATLEGVAGDLAAAVTALEQADATDSAAWAAALETVEAAIEGTTQDLAAAVSTLNEAISAEGEARAASLLSVNARFEDVEGVVDAEVSRLDLALATETEARGAQFTSLSASIAGSEAEIEALSEVVAEQGGGLAGTSVAVRQQRQEMDAEAEASLSALIGADAARRAAAAADVEARQELTTRISAVEGAAAAARLMLAAEVASARASVLAEQIARTNGDSANAQAIQELAVTISNTAGDLAAAVATLEQADVNDAAAWASALSQLEASLNGVEAAAAAQIARLDTVNADQDSANAAAMASVSARMDGVEADVAAEIVRLDSVDATEAEVRGTAITQINARVDGVEGDIAAGITTLQEAIANLDSAMATSIATVEAEIAGNTASITDLVQVLITPEGGATAKAVQLLDVNGRIIGRISTNNGATGAIRYLADVFSIETPEGEQLLYTDEDGTKLKNVEVDTIKASVVQQSVFQMTSAAIVIPYTA